MDVFKLFFLTLLSFIILISCAEEKKAEDVMPKKTHDKPAYCTTNLVPNSYNVIWEDGEFSNVHFESLEQLKEDFVKPNLNEIKQIYYDEIVQFIVPHSDKYLTSDQVSTWGQERIAAQSLWDLGIYGAQNDGTPIIVAVTDTAVYTKHPQIEPNIFYNNNEIPNNGIDDDGNGFIDDVSGWDFVKHRPHVPPEETSSHGTHVAGLIAASHNGPVKGIAPEAVILPISFLGLKGEGPVSGAEKALRYAQQMGARIINASWGGIPCVGTEQLYAIIQSFEKENVLFVTSAGNNGSNLDYFPEYPASFGFPNQLTIAAVGTLDFQSRFSNYSRNSVDLAAPGDKIDSLAAPTGCESDCPLYVRMSGTSMASPLVSGAAALLWSQFPEASVFEIKESLMAGVDPISGLATITEGRLNIYNSYLYLKSLKSSTVTSLQNAEMYFKRKD